ncbi:MAG: enoyl-CoA hydratase/isomerase family protein [Planctomycetota bacterium]
MTDGEDDLAMNAESVEISVEEGIGTIIVNRPEKLNALDNTVIAELASAFEQCFDDGSISVILLTGHGEKAFVAGADIAMLAEQGVLDGKNNSRLGQDLMDLIEEGPKPAIAVVNGYALGGGLELALACDFRYASTTAVFGLPEVSLGIIPGYGGTQRLPRLVGYGRALEMILTGEKIGADEALRVGLVNRVLPPEELMEGARETAKLIASRGPLALMMAKEAVWRGARLPRGDALALEADLFGIISSTGDMEEGMRAFLEKRSPEFKAE